MTADRLAEAPPAGWYREWFDRDYLLVYGHRDARDAARGVALLERTLAPPPGSRILDLACGPGRHAAPLAAAGQRVVGLDLSLDLLAEARALGLGDLVRGDMRALPFRDGAFRAVASFFTSFGYFDEAGDRLVLAEIARVLAPGGGLLLDVADRDHVLAGLAPERSRRLGSTYVIESYRYDVASRRLIKEIEIQEGSDTRRRVESVRLYTAAELDERLAAAGLVPAERFGDPAGGPHLPGRSPRLIVVARRP